jgi:hypothetical protein
LNPVFSGFHNNNYIRSRTITSNSNPGEHLTLFMFCSGKGGPVIASSTGFRFHHLLQLARLRQKYYNSLPHGKDITEPV